MRANLKWLRISAILLMVMMVFACSKKQPADLVLTNGKIITLDEANPQVEALAVYQGKILNLGTSKEIKAHISDTTRVIDLEGKLVIPGLIESHGHFAGLGNSKLKLDLMKVKNWDEIVEMVKEAVAKAEPGEWIYGRGWHQEKWDKVPEPNVDGLPYHNSLSEISPDNPVLLTHASGHANFANAKAMELAGINIKTATPGGGEIVKDEKGNPIGVFRETAQGLFRGITYNAAHKKTPQQAEAEKLKVTRLADQACLKHGITSFHDMGASAKTIDFYKKLVSENKISVRLNVLINESNEFLVENISKYKIIGFADNHFTVRAIKRLIDGALGPHGAWLLEPYTSLPTSTGLNTQTVAVMKETARIAIENDFQLSTHAIGDRANRETLDIYEEAFKSHPQKKDLRWRIEHSQHLHANDIPRFGKLGVIASMQGIHCTSDGPWVYKRLGEKRAKEGAYVWRKLMDSGAVISNGTDVPVEDINPIACFYATVTRKMKDGQLFFSEQKMTREEALRSYTINGAYAAFEEDIKGSLVKGKLADITVLSRDILTIPDDEILGTEVLYTIIGGKVKFKKK